MKPERDSAYLAWIRTLPCLVCRCPSHAHHAEHNGMASKGSDYSAVPLCYVHHNEYHQRGRVWFARYGINFKAAVSRLNKQWQNEKAA